MEILKLFLFSHCGTLVIIFSYIVTLIRHYQTFVEAEEAQLSEQQQMTGRMLMTPPLITKQVVNARGGRIKVRSAEQPLGG